jgi:hypothetical protein
MRIAKSMATTRPAIKAPELSPADKAEVEAAVEVADHAPLRVGDRIEFAVTHELDVDGDKSWVRYGVTSQVYEGESAGTATGRVVSFVNQAVLAAATEVAKQVMER